MSQTITTPDNKQRTTLYSARRHSDRLFVLLYLVFALITITLGPRTFDTNDDVAMQAIAAGDLTGTPDYRWVFSGPLTSWPVTILYRLIDAPWYAVFQYASQLAAGACIVAVFARRRTQVGPIVTLLVLAVLFTVQFRMLVKLGFTGTAFLCGIAGMILLLDANQEHRTTLNIKPIMAILLMALSASIREQVVPALAILFLAVAFLAFQENKSKLLLLSLIPAATVLANHLILRLFASPEYQTYLAYNRVRGSLHGTSRVSPEAIDADLLNRIGWTTTDRALFSSFMHDDQALFGQDVLNEIASATAGRRAHLHLDFFLDNVLLVYPGILTVLLIMIVAQGLRGNWLVALTQLSTMTLAMLALTWTALNVRLPERVSLPMWLGLTVIVGWSGIYGNAKPHRYPSAVSTLALAVAATGIHLMVSGLRPDPSTRPVPQTLAIIVALAFLFLVLSRWRTRLNASPDLLPLAISLFLVLELVVRGPVGITASKAFANTISARYGDQRELLANRPMPTTVVAHGGALVSQGMDPLTQSTIFADEDFLSLGWWIFSPMFMAQTAHLLNSSSSMDFTQSDTPVLWLGTGANANLLELYINRGDSHLEPYTKLAELACSPLVPQVCLWSLNPDTD